MKFFLIGAVVTLVLSVSPGSASNFPPFIKVCSRNSDVSKCVIENIERCRGHFAKGIPRLAIPPLDPFIVPSLTVEGNNLRIHLTNVRVHNLTDMKVVGTDMVLGRHLVMNVSLPNLLTEFEYEADGKLLGLNLKGRGSGYINATGVTINTEVKCHLVEKNGQAYVEIDDINVEYNTKDGTFYADNFFPGHNEINEATNNLINENYKAFQNEVNPDISAAISTLFESIAKNLYGKFSFDELFPEE